MNSRVAVAAASIAALVALTALAIAVATTRSGDSTLAAAWVTASPSPSPSATEPVIPGVASPPPVVQSTVADWVNLGGGRIISAINDDLNGFATVAPGDVGLRAGCVTLGKDVHEARLYPQIPDSQAQGYWAAMLASFTAGVDGHNAKLAGRATTEIQAGGVSFRKLVDRLTAIAPN